MTKTHYIKLNEKFVDAVISGDKSFEIRKNDRGYQKGDYIRFKIVNSDGILLLGYENFPTYEITYVLNGWGLQDGYVVFGIKEVKND